MTNEKTQLETMVIEQQSSILSAFRVHVHSSQADALLLTESECSQSLIIADQEESPKPADLYRYQDKSVAGMDSSDCIETAGLLSICGIATPYSQNLLDRWTSLPQFDDRIRAAERDAQIEKKERLQPMVESDDEDETDPSRTLSGNGARMATSRKSDSIQPLFTEAHGIPVPTREHSFGPAAPPSPAASPRASRSSVIAPVNEEESPTSPRSSISSLPVDAAAAVEAKEDDDDIDLEIPWTLCTRKHYWKYIDNKIVRSDTDQPPMTAFAERNSWTEIMASWVCKEAIREAGYRVTQVQKEKRDGRRTKFETCFCVEKPLQFQQVKQLVERTVELYRQRKPATPPPPPPPAVRRSSFNRPPSSPLNVPHVNGVDRDRTPIPHRLAQQPVDRPTTSMLYPPPPPRLDRSHSEPGSSPGSRSTPMPVPGFQVGSNSHATSLHIPMAPSSPYSSSLPMGPQSPQQAPYNTLYNSNPQLTYPPNPSYKTGQGMQQSHQPFNTTMPHSPLRQSHLQPTSKSRYEDEYTTADSEQSDRDRRRQRSKSRSRYEQDRRRKGHKKSKAAGALLGVGGLTALLDGLSGL